MMRRLEPKKKVKRETLTDRVEGRHCGWMSGRGNGAIAAFNDLAELGAGLCTASFSLSLEAGPFGGTERELDSLQG